MPYYTIQYCTLLYSTVLYFAVLYCTVILQCTVPYGGRLALLDHLPAGSGEVALQLQLTLQQVPGKCWGGLRHGPGCLRT